MRKTLLALAITLLILPTSCKKKSGDGTGTCTGVVCTADFAMISLKIINAAGEAVNLSDSYTVTSSGDTIRFDQLLSNGRYVVLDDSYHSKLTNKTGSFTFYGVMNNKVVVTEAFTISGDCCHIQYKSGNTEILIP
ncbi:MAG: hypothetical protein H6551_04125 [Chitinophagales bacterium]|nr:hypothetical protein [Chitinophagaceae bacterium]MCB9064310.1 hypothetical protein [Chitinophagales bacterium]